MDLALLHAVNGLAGWPVLDWLAVSADRFNLGKGGITIATFWWSWFFGDEKQRVYNRRVIIATFIASFAAIILARAMTVFLPFRVRPLHALDSGYRAPSIKFDLTAEDWSSFPSDHAAMWFALCYGLWRISRVFGMIALAYSAIVVCLVRLYLGFHYPSDLAAGAVVGMLSGWAILRMPLTKMIRPILGLEHNAPYLFYALAFMLTFEVANIFDDVRALMHGLRVIHPSRDTVLIR
jgi:undecaprenyl-diphosphatase